MATASALSAADNEDFAAVAPSAAVLLDGASMPAGADSGCAHGVAWFARTLGAALIARACDPASGPLSGCLRAAIENVRAQHGGSCDLEHPWTPTATVVAIRVRGGELEHLVLADSSLVLTSVGGAMQVVTDRRLDTALHGTRSALREVPLRHPDYAAAFRDHLATVQSRRNSPGGFWVAAADPAVADYALTGSTPLPSVESALLVSDGASRLTDLFGLASWAELTAIVRGDGPAELIRRVRVAEASDPDGARWHRSKATDDATVVYCDQFDD
jgi:Protein phosphatase 2C